MFRVYLTLISVIQSAVEIRRRGEKGPWATSSFIISGNVLDEAKENYKNQSSVKIIGVLIEI